MKKQERVANIVKTIMESHLDTENINETDCLYYLSGYDKNIKIGDLIEAINLIKSGNYSNVSVDNKDECLEIKSQEIEEMVPSSLIELYNILKLHLEVYNHIANKGCEINSYKERLIAADRKVRCYNLMNKIENVLIIDPNNYDNLENMSKLELYDLEAKVEFTINILKSRGCGEDIIKPYEDLALDIKYM